MVHHHARRALAASLSGPLRIVAYDDALFLVEGKFSQAANVSGWPGGLYRNSITLANNLQVGEPLTQVTLPIFRVTGRPDEGFEIAGSQEDSGRVEFWLRALQGANQAWQKVLDTVGSGVPYLTYLGGGAPGELSAAVFRSDAPPPGYQPQSYFDRMQDAMLYVRGLPPGQYQARLVKKVNAAAGDGTTSDRATYLDLLRVYTYA